MSTTASTRPTAPHAQIILTLPAGAATRPASKAAPARPARPARSILLGLLALFLLLTSAACSSGSGGGPTAPAATPNVTGQAVSTFAGDLKVVSHGCGEDLDVDRMVKEVYTTMSIAERQNGKAFGDGSALDGFEIHARSASDSASRCGGNAACFEPVGSRGRLHVWCDGGGLEHETAHALGWSAQLDCWESVYHSRNFRCERTNNPYGA